MTGARPATTTGAAGVVLGAVGGLLAVLVLIAAAAGAVAGLAVGGPGAGGAGGGGPGGSVPSGRALDDIPAPMLALYQQAAPRCPGLDWSVLAAIGSVETDHGRSRLPGVSSGQNSAGAAGPMQFLAPTFAAVIAAHPPPPGGAHPPSRYDPHDAVHAATAYLCDNGAGSGGPTATEELRRALWAYNPSDAYVAEVLARAESYRGARPDTAPGAIRAQGWSAEAATVADPTVPGARITPRMHALYRALDDAGAAPGATCWSRHPQNPASDHPRGRACDLFFDAADPADVARGWQVARHLTTVQAVHGIRYLIWQGRIWTAEAPTWRPYTSGVYGCPDPSNITGCHYDHIHVSVY